MHHEDGKMYRRRTQSILWSDNGTNFARAEKELLLCIESWNGQAPASLVHQGLKWKHNLLGVPHHGGFFRKGYRALANVFSTQRLVRKLTKEVLSTIFCSVEQA